MGTPRLVPAVCERPPCVSAPTRQVSAAPAHAKGRKKSKTHASGKGQKQSKNGKAEAAQGFEVVKPAPLPAPPALPTRYRGVALLPVLSYEVDEALVQTETQSLLDEIDEVSGLQSISPQDVIAESGTFGLHVEACDRDLTCLAQAGRYSRAHLAMEVRLSGLGGTLNLALRLIDTEKAVELTRVAEPLPDDPQARSRQTHRLAVAVLNPNAYVGDLSVTCPTLGAEVFLDDKLLGQTPLDTQKNLPAGLHVLRMSKGGFSDINRFVDVVYNRASTVQVDFNDTTVAGVIVEQISPAGFGQLFLLTNDPGLEVRVDGEPVGITPLRGSVSKVAVGTRHISLRRAGQPAVTLDVEVKPSLRTDVVLRTTPEGAPMLQSLGAQSPTRPLPDMEDVLHPEVAAARAAAAAAAAEQARAATEVHPFPTWRFYSGIALSGVGAVGLVVAGVLAHEVADYNAEALAIVTQGRTANWDLQTRNDKAARLAALNQLGPRAALGQWIGWGAGAALLGTGVGFVIWDWVRTEPAAATARSPAQGALLLPWIDPQGAGFALRSAW